MMTWWNDGSSYGYGSWWGGLGMVLMMLLVWLPLIGLGIWLVGRLTRSEPRTPNAPHSQLITPEPARAILDRRFANGEITAEQYAEMRRTLDQ